MSESTAATLPVLGVFAVSYFSQVDWKARKFEVVSSDEAQVRAWADQQCPPEYRGKIRFGIHKSDPGEDTLLIERVRAATLPVVIQGQS